jgi:hypothetical protein
VITMAYADRKNTLTKKQIVSFSKWANRPRADQPQITEQRRNLWTALNEFIRQNGGSIVSLQFTSPLRLEVPINSPLPERLAALGYDPIFCEQTTRIGPQAVQHDRRGRALPTTGYSFNTFDVFHLKLPK